MLYYYNHYYLLYWFIIRLTKIPVERLTGLMANQIDGLKKLNTTNSYMLHCYYLFCFLLLSLQYQECYYHPLAMLFKSVLSIPSLIPHIHTTPIHYISFNSRYNELFPKVNCFCLVYQQKLRHATSTFHHLIPCFYFALTF